MSTVTLTLNIGGASFPAGTTLGNIQATLTGTNAANNQAQSVAAGTGAVVFSNVAADTYAISVQQQDGSGNALGAALTGSVVVSGNITLNVPLSFTAAVS